MSEIAAWHQVPGAPAPGSRLGHLDELADGAAALHELGDPARPFRYILLRSGEQIYAYVNRCAHFGVPLANKLEHLGVKPHTSIHCCVHYARYRWQDGYCEYGDCVGESLLMIPLRIVDGEIQVAPPEKKT